MASPDKNTNQNSQLNTPRLPFVRGLTNNSTQTSALSLLVPTITQPVTTDDTSPASNTVVIDCRHNFTELAFFGTDADNETVAARVYLWTKVNGSVPVWTPRLVLDVTATLSSALNGVSGAAVTDSEYIADTLVSGTVRDSLSVPTDNLWSPGTSLADAGIATVTVDTMGYELLQVQFDLGTAASANVMYRQF